MKWSISCSLRRVRSCWHALGRTRCIKSILGRGYFILHLRRGCSCFLGITHIAVESGLGDAHHVADFFDGGFVLVVESHGKLPFVRIQRFASPTQSPTGTGSGESSAGTFLDKIPLKFRQCAENMKDKPARRCTGIDVFMETVQRNAALFQIPSPTD
jgi:hypothetical protein